LHNDCWKLAFPLAHRILKVDRGLKGGIGI